MAALSSDRWIAAAGAMLAALGIGLGAFGAHGLEARLDAAALGWWQTAVQYQMWNAVGLVALGLAPAPPRTAAVLIGAGTLVFSGTLYVLALGGPRWLGMVTPLGGVLMILGWLLAAYALVRR